MPLNLYAWWWFVPSDEGFLRALCVASSVYLLMFLSLLLVGLYDSNALKHLPCVWLPWLFWVCLLWNAWQSLTGEGKGLLDCVIGSYRFWTKALCFLSTGLFEASQFVVFGQVFWWSLQVRLKCWCRFLRVQIWEALAYQFDRFMVFRLVAGYGLMFLGKGFRFVAWNAVLCYWQGLTGFEPRLCVFCELEAWQVLGWRFLLQLVFDWGLWLRQVICVVLVILTGFEMSWRLFACSEFCFLLFCNFCLWYFYPSFYCFIAVLFYIFFCFSSLSL